MADVHSVSVRSFNMSQIKGKDTKPEIIVRSFLHRSGFRYGLHNKLLPGKPDLVLRKYQIIIFIHGCFWHGHEGCRYFIIPKTRTQWWTEKIGKNHLNDLKHQKMLKQLGWTVLNIWECELKPAKREKTLMKIIRKIEARHT